jgi:hypothetical protein
VIAQPVHSWATDWTIGVLGFDCRRRLGIFLFTTASRTALALSLEVKRPGREADHSLPSSAEVKNAWSYTSTPQYFFMAWCLVKHRDNFTFHQNTEVNSSTLSTIRIWVLLSHTNSRYKRLDDKCD